jgi:hypothetical protein
LASSLAVKQKDRRRKKGRTSLPFFMRPNVYLAAGADAAGAEAADDAGAFLAFFAFLGAATDADAEAAAGADAAGAEATAEAEGAAAKAEAANREATKAAMILDIWNSF